MKNIKPEGEVDLKRLEEISGGNASQARSTPALAITTIATPDIMATTAIATATINLTANISKYRSCGRLCG